MKSVLAGCAELVLEKTEPRALQAGGPPPEEDGETNRSHVQVLSGFSLSCEPLTTFESSQVEEKYYAI